MLNVQLRRRIFRQTIPIEEGGLTPLPTKFVKVDGRDESICAIKALAVAPRGIALIRTLVVRAIPEFYFFLNSFSCLSQIALIRLVRAASSLLLPCRLLSIIFIKRTPAA